MIQIVECPRDAMQGVEKFIPTTRKVNYINSLLKVGFHSLDFGSFVSPKTIPQMRDTAKVLSKLELDKTSTQLLSIVANQRGVNDAVSFDEINYLGYPFSVSQIFQQRNTNSNIDQSFSLIDKIQKVCADNNKELVIYLSMAFGNPYREDWHPDIVVKHTEIIANMGIKIIALSDTIGVSTKNTISHLFSSLIPAFKHITFGAHFHTTPETWKEKILSAYLSGCKRFDTAIQGFGGCPMAKDKLTGNMPTEKLISFFNEYKEEINLNTLAFESAFNQASSIFIP